MISIQFKTTVMSGMRWVGLFLLLTYGTASMAHAARPLPATVDNLMDLSGIKEQYSDMPEDVTAGLMEQRESFEMLTDADFGSLTSKVVTIFQPERILEAIRREIVNTLTEDEIKQLLEWYRSDLGRKITNLEIQASTRESHRKMLALKELQLTKTDRVAFARRFDELLDLSSFAVEYYKIQQEAMVVALKEILGAEALIDPEDYSQHISRFEEEILRQAKEMITVSVVFTYRGLNDTELEQYMEFNRQEYSLKLSRAVFNGAIGAMRGMLEQMVRAAQDTPQ